MKGIGPCGPLADRFEEGMRYLVVALALGADHRSTAAAVQAACDAIRCFLDVLAEAAARHLPDPEGEVLRLHAQCTALLTLRQDEDDAMVHAIEAARLARNQAARLLPILMLEDPGSR